MVKAGPGGGLTGPNPGVEPGRQNVSVAHRSVPVDAPAGVEVAEVNRAAPRACLLHPINDLLVLTQPMFDEVAECRKVNGPACGTRGRQKWFPRPGVGTRGAAPLVFPPVAVQNILVRPRHPCKEFRALPKCLDRHRGNVLIMVGDDAIGRVAPTPTRELALLGRVIPTTGVDHEGVGGGNFGPHADGREVTHADDVGHRFSLVGWCCSPGPGEVWRGWAAG
jgi:hypothetical protein